MRKASLALVLVPLGLLAVACGGTPQATTTPVAVTPLSQPAVQAPADIAARSTAVAASPTATVVVVAPTPTVTSLGDLTVEEYPIVAKEVDTPSHFGFKDRIAPAVLEKRSAWRTIGIEQGLQLTNQALAPLGYSLVQHSTQDGQAAFDLLRGDTPVLEDLSMFYPVSVAASGHDFCMVVDDAKFQELLVRAAGVDPWYAGQHGFMRPVMVGDDLVSIEAAANGRDWNVVRGDQVVYTVRDKPIMVADPLKGLWSWQGHWVLEVDGQLIVDGEDQNQALGYDEIFGWQLVAGQPFYFFKKDGRIGISYAGETLAPHYDDVIHYQCCEPAAFNVSGNGAMVWGYALREGVWNYVEIGVYR